MQFYRVLLTIVSETVKMSKINWINRLIVSRLILAFNRAVVWGTPSPHLMTYSANSQSWAMHVWWRPCLSSTAETQTQEHLDQWNIYWCTYVPWYKTESTHQWNNTIHYNQSMVHFTEQNLNMVADVYVHNAANKQQRITNFTGGLRVCSRVGNGSLGQQFRPSWGMGSCLPPGLQGGSTI